jgi:hypothetical protein
MVSVPFKPSKTWVAHPLTLKEYFDGMDKALGILGIKKNTIIENPFNGSEYDLN